MSREEAAAKASYAFMENSTPEMFYADSGVSHLAYLDDAKRMLDAADAHDAANGIHRISLDDATVERAARALEPGYWRDGNGWSDWSRERSKDKARAVLAAAVKEEA